MAHLAFEVTYVILKREVSLWWVVSAEHQKKHYFKVNKFKAVQPAVATTLFSNPVFELQKEKKSYALLWIEGMASWITHAPEKHDRNYSIGWRAESISMQRK